MQIILLALMLSAMPAEPQVATARDADSAVTEGLNRAVADHNRAIVVENARRDAAYQAERARYEAALAENARIRAEADSARSAFAAAERRHEADMAAWRAASAGTRPARPVEARTVAPTPRPACTTGDLTGSLVRKTRSCRR